MSKAKELAKKLLMTVGTLNEVEYKTLGLELIDAVLSEPEGIKGWIEVQCPIDGVVITRCINITMIIDYGVNPKGNTFICLVGCDDGIVVKESYDEIKQKIARAV